MKKITLYIGLSLMSLVGYAQQTSDNTLTSQVKERESEYIIVLDDTKVEGNIDTLLKESDLHDATTFNGTTHELAHSEPDTFNLEGKLVEGAFSYNDYAVHYKLESQVSVAAS